jgi:hypothetical protein
MAAPMPASRALLVIPALLLSATALASSPEEIADAIVKACPIAEPTDESARQRCADALASSAALDA